jgi:hypothetical protein
MAFRQQKFISPIVLAEKSKIKVPEHSSSGEVSFLVHIKCCLACLPIMQDGKKLPGIFFL